MSILYKTRNAIKSNNRIYKDLNFLTNNKRILDLGCGRGDFLSLLGKRGVGIDGSLDNVNNCMDRGLLAYYVKLPAKLPFDKESFDSVYCSHLIEHFLPNEAFQIVSEIDRILCSGGILIIRTPLFTSSFYDDPTHIRPYHLHCILHMLGGWEITGSRQMIFGKETRNYIVKYYYEEIYPLYTSKIAPTIAPKRFPLRLILRGLSHLMVKIRIGRKGAYGAILIKNKINSL